MLEFLCKKKKKEFIGAWRSDSLTNEGFDCISECGYEVGNFIV